MVLLSQGDHHLCLPLDTEVGAPEFHGNYKILDFNDYIVQCSSIFCSVFFNLADAWGGGGGVNLVYEKVNFI